MTSAEPEEQPPSSQSSSELPPGLDDAFGSIAGELGQATASWLFVRAVARCTGDEGVHALAERVGPSYPVLDAVARMWLEGTREHKIDVGPVLEALGNATRVVVVGVEASFLDAIIEKADPRLRIAILAHSPFVVDWDRVLDNCRGRADRVDLDTFQAWAGTKSALMTFSYGRNGSRTAVMPLWLRTCGEDVRSQFRSLIACDVLGTPLRLYPRWLVEVEAESFTRCVP
jgi:hypothetical protein